MKFAPLAPLAAALLLAACSNNDSAADPTAESDAPTAPAAEGAKEERAARKPKLDPNMPADQFVALRSTGDCLGLAWHSSDDAGRELVRNEFANMLDGANMQRIKDVFAKKDFVASLEPEIVSRVAPWEGKRFLTYTTEPRESYREYNFDNQSFYDDSRLTGSAEMVFSESQGNGGQPGRCGFKFTNGGAWKSMFVVKDEQQARAASAALAARNGSVKYYFHVDGVDFGENFIKRPTLQATIVRVELVDAQGNVLATPEKSMTDEAAAEMKAAAEEACRQNPARCW